MWCSRNDLMRRAMAEAGKHLRKLGIDFTEPIDVFRIINDMGIELIFRPLDEADGFYIPPINSRARAGILLLMTSQKYPTVIIEKCPTPL